MTDTFYRYKNLACQGATLVKPRLSHVLIVLEVLYFLMKIIFHALLASFLTLKLFFFIHHLEQQNKQHWKVLSSLYLNTQISSKDPYMFPMCNLFSSLSILLHAVILLFAYIIIESRMHFYGNIKI